MWQLWSIIAIIIIALVLLFSFKIIKSIFKLASIFVILLLVVFGVFSYLVYLDIMDLQENFPEKDNLFILYKDNSLLTGIKIKLNEVQELEEKESLNILSQDKINTLNQYYGNQEFDKILENNYKIILINYDVFNDIEQVDLQKEKFSNEFVLGIMESSQPDDILKQELIKRDYNELLVDKAIPEDVKSSFFILLLNKKIEKEPLFFITEIKSKNVIIYPETLTFQVIDYLSIDFIKEKLSSLIPESPNQVEGFK